MIKRHLPGHCHPNRRFRSVDGAVIHFISDRYQHPDDPYNLDNIYKLLSDYKLSYHVIIPRSGEPIELVPSEFEAWHAGRSRLNGRDYCNRWTHGIALVGMPGISYTSGQINRLIDWLEFDMGLHGYGTMSIKGHDDVRAAWNAAYPDRAVSSKPDPGALFPWDKIYETLGHY